MKCVVITLCWLMLSGCGVAAISGHGPDLTAPGDSEDRQGDEAPGASESEAGEDLEAAQAFLAELDGRAGAPSVRGLQPVLVYTGYRSYSRGPDREEETLYGLLVSEGLDSFEVIHSFLPSTYQRGSGIGDSRARSERVEWTEVINAWIRSAQMHTELGTGGRFGLGERYAADPRLRTVMFARIAAHNGFDSEADELLRLALRMRGPSSPLGTTGPVEGIRGDMALFEYGVAV